MKKHLSLIFLAALALLSWIGRGPNLTRPSSPSQLSAPGQTQPKVTHVSTSNPSGAVPLSPAVVSIPSPTSVLPSVASRQLPNRTLRQMQALHLAKSQWTAAQRKLDTHLLSAVLEQKNQPVAENVAFARQDFQKDDRQRVAVDINADISGRMELQMQRLGISVVASYPTYHSLRAWVPVTSLEKLAALPQVRSIEPAQMPVMSSGSLISEGDATHGAGTARSTYGFSGLGVKVGVLSDSVRYLAASQSSSELGQVTVLAGQDGVDEPASPPDEGEGTAMLEIIHDLAPDAQLFYATAFGGASGFATNILRLREAGCDIIVDDVGYLNESPFQDGPIAQAVNAVTASGALYFSSAGNSGNMDQLTGSTWEGDFVAGRILADAPYEGIVNDFGSGTLFNTVVHSSSSRSLAFHWADPLGASDNDYEIYVIDAEGNIVDYSLRTQDGTQDPYEFVSKISPSERIVVSLRSGAPRYLRMTCQGKLALQTPGNTSGHACSASAFGVAAIRAGASFPSAFDGSVKDQVEDFSSDGPRRVFFKPDGSPITPGNFSSTGGELRLKPDIAAADGVKTSVPAEVSGRLIFNPFYGTSAASPHAAAIAALMRAANPALRVEDVRELFRQTALDLPPAGPDRNSGYGVIMADRLLAEVLNPQRPAVESFTPTTAATGQKLQVSGQRFSSVTEAYIGSIPALFRIVSDTSLEITIPPAAGTGFVRVRSPKGPSQSLTPFTSSDSPNITKLLTLSGLPGATVTVQGTNLGAATSVLFGGIPSPHFNSIAGGLAVEIPSGGRTSRLVIQTPQGTAISAETFTVLNQPSFESFSPSSGPVGQAVSISGSNFWGATSVKFGSTVTTNIAVDDDDLIYAEVPPGANTGRITVIAPGGNATSTNDFVVVSAPSNDLFSNPISIGSGSNVSGDNTGAAKEKGEPNHAGSGGGKSLWYRFTPSTTKYYRVRVVGQQLDSILGLYAGKTITNLTTLGGADDSGGVDASQLTFLGRSGTNYSLAVDGFWGSPDPSSFAAGGPFQISLTTVTAPEVTFSVTPTNSGPGGILTLTGPSLGLVREIRLSGLRLKFDALSTNTLKAFLPPGVTDGPLCLTTPIGSFVGDQTINIGNPPNDLSSQPSILAGSSGTIYGNNSFATGSPDDPALPGKPFKRTVWYVWTAPSDGTYSFGTRGSVVDTILAVLRRPASGSPQLVTANDDTDGQTYSRVRFAAKSDEDYLIEVDTSNNDQGSFVLSWELSPGRPFVAALFPRQVAIGDTVVISGNSLGQVVAIESMPGVRANFAQISDTELNMVVPQGTVTGPIRLITYGGDAMSIQELQIKSAPPANDAVGSLINSPWIAKGSTRGATPDAWEVSQGASPSGHSVFHRFVAPQTGLYLFDASESGFSVILRVYRSGAAQLNQWTQGRPPADRFLLSATAGTEYVVSINGQNDATGNYVLRIAPATAPRFEIASGFEVSDQFDAGFTVRGQAGWTQQGGSVGNGIVDDFFGTGGQQAYFGFGSTPSANTASSLRPPFIANDPTVNGTKLASFRIDLSIYTGSNRKSTDIFGWAVMNPNNTRLCAILFNNKTGEIGYSNNGSIDFHPTGKSFLDYTSYRLLLLMDFDHNQWSAYLGDVLVIDRQVISTQVSNAVLSGVAAIWQAQPDIAGESGFMVFDNYYLKGETSLAPTLVGITPAATLAAGAPTSFSINASSPVPLTYQWFHGTEPVAGGTNSILDLGAARAEWSGTYHAVASNGFGQVEASTSLTVLPPVVPSIASVNLAGANQLNLQIGAPDPRFYVIESSTDLFSWEAPAGLNGSVGQSQIPLTNGPIRFFRLRRIP